MSGAKQPLAPLTPGKVKVYVCGPTVYSFVHIGNARTFTSFDVVVRYLRYRGFEVKYVRNYTDVDDKIINAARVVGEWGGAGQTLSVEADGTAKWGDQSFKWTTDGHQLSLISDGTVRAEAPIDVGADTLTLQSAVLKRTSPEIDAISHAARFVREFEQDARALHLLEPDVSPKVSDTIPEIVEIIQRLISREVAYASKGDVYFQVSRYPQYARLSKRKLDDLKAGARVEPQDAKREPLDFALWKAAKPGEPSWDSPWGKGRPGWHIECSAMSNKFLGETFDLHGGGLDLIFPHHENEIAQSEAASGAELCKCWMHGGFLDLEGAKMSKSLGNVVRLRDALARVDAEALRYFFLSTHYRAPLAFTDQSLADAEARLEYFYETLRRANERPAAGGKPSAETEKWLQQLEQTMDDDFNFAGALGALSGLFGEMNQLLDSKDKGKANAALGGLRDSVKKISSVLGLFEDDPAAWLLRRRDRLVQQRGIDVSKIDALITARNDARKAKDFKRADEVRGELKALGIEIMDTPTGTSWKVAADQPAK
ncbi:MAG: cysteine--tRNA ligase [Archangiaceae bacterium]|nr:cysteine--tRNA ligase [Archangiaceae bacterium]